MKRTKIICTIGPSSNNLNTICALMKNGMNVARLNMSHGNFDDHQHTLDLVKQARKHLDTPCAIMVDTCGPELRIGTFANYQVTLEKGQEFVFSTTKVEGDKNQVWFNFPELLKILKPKQKIYANNGLLEFSVKKIEESKIVCKVLVGGTLSNNKSVSIPHIRIPLPFINDRDKQNIEFAVKNDVEYISASFVNSVGDVLEMKALIEKLGGRQKIIAKIESLQGLKNLKSIIDNCEGIMVARGDLGTEIAIEQIPSSQKQMIKHAISKGKIVIVATEMLESMILKRRPTRAETTDVAQAIYDKTSATMLSGETASGEYPVVACQTMKNIALATEKNINYDSDLLSYFSSPNKDLDAISYSACSASRAVNAKAIVCFTDGGKTARMISRFRPKATIVALTHDYFTYNSLGMIWGVLPFKVDEIDSLDNMVKIAKKIVLANNIAKPNDKIIITLGLPTEKKGTTNAIHICKVD